MADFSLFRSSLNGFNRSDVAAYLEELSQTHRAELAEATQASDALTKELTAAKDALMRQTGHAAALEDKLTAVESKLAATEAKLKETEIALHSTEEALEEALSLVPQESQAEEEPAQVSPDYGSLELEAYRRAEAMERISSERATRLRQQLEEILDHVSSQYEEANQEISVLAEDIQTNLKRLADSLADLDAIFDETTQSFAQLDLDHRDFSELDS